MSNLLITSRPISDKHGAYLLLEKDNGYEEYNLNYGDIVSIKSTDENKYCTGWYDIETSTNYPCDHKMEVDSRYSDCFHCRKKTGFNPAFYNTADISEKQQEFNRQPHSVYIAYFGDGLAKAGITISRRGLERLYEQGALFYTLVSQEPDATSAHRLEARLIRGGLRDSVIKKQKSQVFSGVINEAAEKKKFKEILDGTEFSNSEIVSNLNHFFFGNYPNDIIQTFSRDQDISGVIKGVVGRYLILENNERLYGVWLSDFFGKKINLDGEVIDLDRSLQQVSLF